MLSTLLIVLPIFALILAGWAARRVGALGDTATREINRLVVYVTLPALLFRIMAEAEPAELWQPGFVFAFTGGCAVIFGFTLFLAKRRGQGLADAALDGLNGSYANTGFLGFPLVLAVMGEAGLSLTLIASLVTVTVLFAAAILLVELGLQPDGRALEVAARTLRSFAKNPLVVSPLLGGLYLATGLELYGPLDAMLTLLGDAAAPCALVCLGCFLADPRPDSAPIDLRWLATLVGLKLVAHPLVTWLLALPLGLSADATHAAVLLAALPTGTGPFMLAELYHREAGVTGRTILVTTILSVFTVSLYLAVVG